MIALLNKPRLKTKVLKAGKPHELQHITSLVVVPHRDLAYQFLHWIEHIVTCAAVDSPPPQLSSIVQIMVRDRGAHLSTGLDLLHEISPHILIGTPQALMDVWSKDQQALQLSHLSTVVVDEVDYLVETLPRKDADKSFRPAVARATKRLLSHPGVTRELLDTIYAKRKELYEQRKDEPGLVQHKRRENQEGKNPSPSSIPFPQLILCSATFRGHLRNYLFQESGWLNKDNLLVYKGAVMTGSTSSQPQGGDDVAKSKRINVIGGSGVSHSVLIVSNDGITNIEGTLAGDQNNNYNNPVTPEAMFGAGINPEAPSLDPNLVESKSDSQYIASFVDTSVFRICQDTLPIQSKCIGSHSDRICT